MYNEKHSCYCPSGWDCVLQRIHSLCLQVCMQMCMCFVFVVCVLHTSGLNLRCCYPVISTLSLFYFACQLSSLQYLTSIILKINKWLLCTSPRRWCQEVKMYRVSLAGETRSLVLKLQQDSISPAASWAKLCKTEEEMPLVYSSTPRRDQRAIPFLLTIWASCLMRKEVLFILPLHIP